MYSYKEPRKKSLFDKVTKLWILFISMVLFFIFGYGIYLNNQSTSYGNDLENIIKSNQILSNSVNELEKELKILKMQQILATEVINSNRLLSNSIKNLFNLVPDQIMLLKVNMKKDLLVLDGLSSTKDAYRLLLEPPLKSIFSDSKVSFEFNSTLGRYMFTSINTMIGQSKELDNGKK